MTPRNANLLVSVVTLLASLAAFVLVRSLTRGLPWWLSVALAVVAMLLAGRFAGVLVLDVMDRVRAAQVRRGRPWER